MSHFESADQMQAIPKCEVQEKENIHQLENLRLLEVTNIQRLTNSSSVSEDKNIQSLTNSSSCFEDKNIQRLTNGSSVPEDKNHQQLTTISSPEDNNYHLLNTSSCLECTNQSLVSEFKQSKLEKEAQKHWDLFYKRNTTKFFKDRHWTDREFEELSYSQTVLEVGCGVGNFMFPLLEKNPNLMFYACDFSPRAVNFVKSHPSFRADRCTVFQCDATKDDLPEHVPVESVDVATLIFVLSAIHPDKMTSAVQNIVKTLKPGGVLLVRDYGHLDHAMLRFAKGQKLAENFYVRQDGTRAYYFSIEKLTSIMEDAGLTSSQCSYVHKSTVNNKEGINVARIFVQGKFSKPC